MSRLMELPPDAIGPCVVCGALASLSTDLPPFLRYCSLRCYVKLPPVFGHKEIPTMTTTPNTLLEELRALTAAGRANLLDRATEFCLKRCRERATDGESYWLLCEITVADQIDRGAVAARLGVQGLTVTPLESPPGRTTYRVSW